MALKTYNEIESAFDSIDIYDPSIAEGTVAGKLMDDFYKADDKDRYIKENLNSLVEAFPYIDFGTPDVEKPKSPDEAMTELRYKDAYVLDENSDGYWGNWSVQQLNNRAAERYPDMDLKQARSKLMQDLQESTTDYQKNKIYQQEMNPNLRRDLLGYISSATAKMLFPEMTNAAKAGTLETGMSKELLKDLATNAAGFLNPGTRIAGKFVKPLSSGMGKILTEAGEAAAQEATRQAASDYEEFDPLESLAAGAFGAGGSLVGTRAVGDTFRKLDTDEARAVGETIEQMGFDYSGQLKDRIARNKRERTAGKTLRDRLSHPEIAGLYEEHLDLIAKYIDDPFQAEKLALIKEADRGELNVLLSKYDKGEISARELDEWLDEHLSAEAKGLVVDLRNQLKNDEVLLKGSRNYGKDEKFLPNWKKTRAGIKDTKGAWNKTKKILSKGFKTVAEPAGRSLTKGLPKSFIRKSFDRDEMDIRQEAKTIERAFPDEVAKWKKGFRNNLSDYQRQVLNAANIYRLGDL